MGAEALDAGGRYERRTEAVPAPTAEERFEQILERHHRKLRRFVAGIVADRDRVDDVLQETCIKAFLRLPAMFANEAHETTWLYRVAYRCAIDELRRSGRRRERALGDEAVAEHSDHALRGVAVERAFCALSAADRAVILLVLVVGLDYEHAASTLRIPRGTLAWRLNVARRRFRENLEHEGIDAP